MKPNFKQGANLFSTEQFCMSKFSLQNISSLLIAAGARIILNWLPCVNWDERLHLHLIRPSNNAIQLEAEMKANPLSRGAATSFIITVCVKRPN